MGARKFSDIARPFSGGALFAVPARQTVRDKREASRKTAEAKRVRGLGGGEAAFDTYPVAAASKKPRNAIVCCHELV